MKEFGERVRVRKAVVIFLIPKVQICILEWNKTENKWHTSVTMCELLFLKKLSGF